MGKASPNKPKHGRVESLVPSDLCGQSDDPRWCVVFPGYGMISGLFEGPLNNLIVGIGPIQLFTMHANISTISQNISFGIGLQLLSHQSSTRM